MTVKHCEALHARSLAPLVKARGFGMTTAGDAGLLAPFARMGVGDYSWDMSITAANAAVQLAATVTKGLNALRERAKASNDPELKALILGLYDDVAALKEAVGRVTSENEELLRKLEHPEPTPQARQVGETIYYFLEDDGPYCQPCYDDKRKLVRLTPQMRGPSGAIHRECQVCKQSFYETHVPGSTYTGLGGGRQGWMGS